MYLCCVLLVNDANAAGWAILTWHALTASLYLLPPADFSIVQKKNALNSHFSGALDFFPMAPMIVSFAYSFGANILLSITLTLSIWLSEKNSLIFFRVALDQHNEQYTIQLRLKHTFILAFAERAPPSGGKKILKKIKKNVK